MRAVTGRLLPGSMAGRMIGLLVLSFMALLGALAAVEQQRSSDIYVAAGGEQTASRLQRMAEVLERIRDGEAADHVRAESRCHVGYEVSPAPYPDLRETPRTRAVAQRLADQLDMSADGLRVGLVTLTPDRFGYTICEPGAIAFPVEGLVISLRTGPAQWLHAEIHPHEPHFEMTFADWLRRSALVFLFVAGVASFFVYRLAKPLRDLGDGAQKFGTGLKIDPIVETGPPDLRRVIAAFNAMQQQVVNSVEQRNITLAALSHDLRTPLTALRVKAELVDEVGLRADLVASIEKMETISTSAIEFLQGESRTERFRTVDLASLVESECADFADIGKPVSFVGESPLYWRCRPDALARAVRNLIDNAIKYGDIADVSVEESAEGVTISIADQGPGISSDAAKKAVEPFVRISEARESKIGGSGLGLAVAKAVAEGHGGQLMFAPKKPTGLVVAVFIPRTSEPTVAEAVRSN